MKPSRTTVYGVAIVLRPGVTYDEVVAAELKSSQRNNRADLLAYLSEDLGLCDVGDDLNVNLPVPR